MLVCFSARAGDSTLYNPQANALHEVALRVAQARAEHKRVLLQIGGNWCVMCFRLNALLQTDTALKKQLQNYVVYHVNYSPQNKNLPLLNKLGGPQRYGFPVLVVLDEDGKALFTQSSGGLQRGNGYDAGKVSLFLTEWQHPPTF